MTCDETLWPCWVCRETAVGAEDSARMSRAGSPIRGKIGEPSGPQNRRPGPAAKRDRTNDQFRLRSTDRMSIVAPAPTSVYRYYDKAGVLLYVGITSRGTRRQQEHNYDKEWWPFVTSQQVEHYETRLAAAAREKELIREFRPPFNRVHNPDCDDLRLLYLAAASNLPQRGIREDDGSDVLPASKAFRAVGGKVPLTQIQAGNVAIFVASRAFRDLFRSTPPSLERVILRTPRRRGLLTQIELYRDMPEITFAGERGGIPVLRNVHLHMKVMKQNPFIARMHEAVGEKC